MMKALTSGVRSLIVVFGFGVLFNLLLFVYQDFLSPIFVTAIISYLAWPTVNFLNEKLPVNRGWIAFGVTAMIFSILILAFVRIAPLLLREVIAIGRLAPVAIDFLGTNLVPKLQGFISSFGIFDPIMVEDLFTNFSSSARFGQQLIDAVTRFVNASPSLLGHVVDVGLVPFATFFILKDGTKVSRLLRGLVPPDALEGVMSVMTKIDGNLRSVVKGQALVASCLGVMYLIGFLIIDLPSAIIIAIIAGICRLVPYLDIVVGGFLAFVVALTAFAGWWQLLGIVVVIALVQGIDAALITPRVFGGRLGLHPLVVVFSVLGFANWFGFWGVLFAIPAVAVIKILLEVFLGAYRQSSIYQVQSTPLEASSQDGHEI